MVSTQWPGPPREQWGTDEYKRITAEYRQRSYSAFAAHVYERDESGDDIPEVEDDSAAHYPRVVRFDQRLLHFSSIEARRRELTGADFALVKDRIVEQCLPESDTGLPS